MQEKNNVRVIVAGSRGFNDYQYLEGFCDRIMKMMGASNPTIISGAARGADTLGEEYAKARNYPIEQFPAQWKLYHKSAGMIRNKQMAEYAAKGKGVLVAFWDGKSKGTENMIKEAQKKGLSVFVGMYAEPKREVACQLAFDPQSLCFKDELLERVKAAEQQVDELQQSNPCWKYPYSVGTQDGDYIVAVREGILVVPYEKDGDKEKLLLDRAFLRNARAVQYMADQWHETAEKFRSIIEQATKIYEFSLD